MLSKRAVSPLIAAVLLIVVVVGVGAVVTGIVRGYVTDAKQAAVKQAGQTSCSTDLDLELVVLNSQLQVCKNATDVGFMLTNKGGPIDDMMVKIFSDDDVEVVDSVTSSGMGMGDTRFFSVPHTTIAEDDIIEIHIIPKLMNERGSFNMCTDVPLVANTFKTC